MKKILKLTLCLFALTLTSVLCAQNFSGLDKSPLDMAAYPSDYKISDKIVRISYGRPQLKGRAIGDLAPTGKVWRTGANEAPEITFYQDVNFGGNDIAAGTYSLFTIPGEKEWTIILNTKLNQWGSYFYDKTADVARAKAASTANSKPLEAFSIAFKDVDGGTEMVMGWGKTRISVPILIK